MSNWKRFAFRLIKYDYSLFGLIIWLVDYLVYYIMDRLLTEIIQVVVLILIYYPGESMQCL